jgi:hypothetical protein
LTNPVGWCETEHKYLNCDAGTSVPIVTEQGQVDADFDAMNESFLRKGVSSNMELHLFPPLLREEGVEAVSLPKKEPIAGNGDGP